MQCTALAKYAVFDILKRGRKRNFLKLCTVRKAHAANLAHRVRDHDLLDRGTAAACTGSECRYGIIAQLFRNDDGFAAIVYIGDGRGVVCNRIGKNILPVAVFRLVAIFRFFRSGRTDREEERKRRQQTKESAIFLNFFHQITSK